MRDALSAFARDAGVATDFFAVPSSFDFVSGRWLS